MWFRRCASGILEALDEEHERKLRTKETGEELKPEVFSNGDTRPQLLARSRYLLFKSRDKWTESQKARAMVLFEQYPDLKEAYDLTDSLRRVFSNSPDDLWPPQIWQNGTVL